MSKGVKTHINPIKEKIIESKDENDLIIVETMFDDLLSLLPTLNKITHSNSSNPKSLTLKPINNLKTKIKRELGELRELSDFEHIKSHHIPHPLEKTSEISKISGRASNVRTLPADPPLPMRKQKIALLKKINKFNVTELIDIFSKMFNDDNFGVLMMDNKDLFFDINNLIDSLKLLEETPIINKNNNINIKNAKKESLKSLKDTIEKKYVEIIEHIKRLNSTNTVSSKSAARGRSKSPNSARPPRPPMPKSATSATSAESAASASRPESAPSAARPPRPPGPPSAASASRPESAVRVRTKSPNSTRLKRRSSASRGRSKSPNSTRLPRPPSGTKAARERSKSPRAARRRSKSPSAASAASAARSSSTSFTNSLNTINAKKLDDILKTIDLEISETDADGNCYFYSIYDSLNSLSSILNINFLEMFENCTIDKVPEDIKYIEEKSKNTKQDKIKKNFVKKLRFYLAKCIREGILTDLAMFDSRNTEFEHQTLYNQVMSLDSNSDDHYRMLFEDDFKDILNYANTLKEFKKIYHTEKVFNDTIASITIEMNTTEEITDNYVGSIIASILNFILKKCKNENGYILEIKSFTSDIEGMRFTNSNKANILKEIRENLKKKIIIIPVFKLDIAHYNSILFFK